MKRYRWLLFALLVPFWLAGCETARELGDLFTEDQEPVPADLVRLGEISGVLDKPRPVSPSDIRRAWPDGLFADRQNAVHGAPLTAEGTALPPALPPGAEDPAATLAAMPPGETGLIPASPLPPPAPVAVAPAPPPLGPEVWPEPGTVGGGRIEMVGIIFFAHASAQLDSRDREVLEAVIALHRERGGVIRILGFASDSGGGGSPNPRDIGISLARAESVGWALVRLGVDPLRILPEGRALGGGTPSYEFMPEGEDGERRVEIYLEY